MNSNKSLALLALLLVNTAYSASAQTYYPEDDGGRWDTIAPSDIGFCQDSITSLYTYLEDEKTKSFILLKDGKIVLEKYFGTFTQDSLYIWFSAGKSLRSFLVGVAQEEGHLSISDKTSDHLGTGWSSLSSVQEDAITIWHQLTMTSGLDETEFDCVSPSCLIYKAAAGTRWAYHNGPYNLLLNVLESSTGNLINTYTTQKVKNKTGMGTGFWLKTGTNTFYFSKARDMARFGLMIQNKGIWNGDTLLHDTSYMRQMLNSSQSLNPSYGYLWWLNGKNSFIPPELDRSFPGPIAPKAPLDMYTAAGAQGQFISISPSTGYVLIRQGQAKAQQLTAISILDGIWERVLNLDCTAGSPAVTKPPITVYPNPTNGIITIGGILNPHLDIIDQQGRVIRVSETNRMDLSLLDAGLYWLRITNGGQVLTKKIVKL